MPCSQVYFDNNGNVDEEQTEYLGIDKNNLVAIPANAFNLSIEYHGFENLQEPLRICYYSDKNAAQLIAVKDYFSDGLMSVFMDITDLDTGLNYNTTSGYIFENDIPDTAFYMGLCFKGNAEDDAYIKVYYNCQDNMHLVNTDYMFDNPGIVSTSPRSMVGYMAGLLGGNAKMTRDGKLGILTYNETEITIDPDVQHLDGIQKYSNSELEISYIVTGVDENEGASIVIGSGNFGFNFANPFIQEQSVAQNILNLYKGIKVLPCKIDHRGNPALESGDIITVTDIKDRSYKTIILSQEIDVDGGFAETSECNIDVNAKVKFISTPSSKSITAKFDSFVQKYQSIIESLTGVSGGYVKFVYDSFGKMRAIAIPDTDIELKWDDDAGKVIAANGDTNLKMWVWSNGGEGYTKDGGKTYEIAKTKDGRMYANYLLSPIGTIGGWEIGENCLYKDCGNYRTLIQSPTNSNTGVFAVRDMTTGSPTFYINAMGGARFTNNVQIDGKASVYGELTVNGTMVINQYVKDVYGYEVINTNSDGALVIGYGQYEHDNDTWLEGSNVYIRAMNNSKFTITSHKRNGVSMPTIYSSSDFILSTPDGKAIFLKATGGIYVDDILNANGGITTSSSITAKGGIDLSGNGYLDVYNDSNNHTVIQASDAPYLDLKTNGSGGYIKVWNKDFRLAIGVTSGSAPLYVNSTGTITISSSSQRYKENITTELNNELNPNKLYDLPIVQYNYKNEFKDKELVEGTQIGITAEDVHEYYPNACIYNDDGEPESWQDRIMIPAMLKLIQEQKTQIDNLEKRIKTLEKRQN